MSAQAIFIAVGVVAVVLVALYAVAKGGDDDHPWK